MFSTGSPLRAAYIPQLDGLRAFAILPVLLAHSFYLVPHLPLASLGTVGWMGVDLFFVLSGFLITGILLDTKSTPGYFRNFYARRGLRIWPLYYLLLAFIFIVSPQLHNPRYFPVSALHWGFYAFYLQNTFFYARVPMALAVTWSLAVEEQFYLVWPVLVARLKRQRLITLMVALVIAMPIARWFTFPIIDAGSNVFFRVDELCFGALAACWMRSPDYDAQRFRKISWWGLGVLAASVGAALYDGRPGLEMPDGYLFSLVAFGCLGLLGMALVLPATSRYVRFLSWAPLRYIGKISYGLYILHSSVFRILMMSPLYGWVWAGNGPAWAREVVFLLVLWGAVFLLAALSWWMLESPLLRLKRHFEVQAPAPEARAPEFAYAAHP